MLVTLSVEFCVKTQDTKCLNFDEKLNIKLNVMVVKFYSITRPLCTYSGVGLTKLKIMVFGILK